ncbi:STAS domain-containing protein [Parachitinimonas caeni]|uniref:STAS domain-containing protein n=1 Tax=Parachitinimonas caeni TaxID=3031301 RepID=A0ABT7DVG3_9NEIS|nr:STAS domain-containing protein [Parachitinimonas caeni]MDK2124054.1 STAS domain-containing protein [Parachitinimonas caeni]
MGLNSIHRGEQCVLRISGDLTIYTATTTKERLLDELRTSEQLEVDLSEVDEIDTAGIQLLLLLKREAAAANKVLAFHGHSRAVLEVLDLYNMAWVFGDPVLLSGEH